MDKQGKADDLLKIAEQIILGAVDEKTHTAIFELCKYHLTAYTSYIKLGCRPQEAHRHTRTHLEAMFRANGKI